MSVPPIEPGVLRAIFDDGESPVIPDREVSPMRVAVACSILLLVLALLCAEAFS